MDSWHKGTRQQNIQLYQVVKAGQLLHQGRWLPRNQIPQKFPHIMQELEAMETVASYGGEVNKTQPNIRELATPSTKHGCVTQVAYSPIHNSGSLLLLNGILLGTF